MTFGLQTGKKPSGAGIYLYVFQAASLLPLPYMLTVSGYAGLVARRGALSFLFDAGFAAMSRAQALGLSCLYRRTAHEPVVYFAIPVIALLFGIVMKKLLQGGLKTARAVRIALCVWIAADLLLRLFTPQFHVLFGWPAAIIGLVIRLAMLGLLTGDLIAEKKHS